MKKYSIKDFMPLITIFAIIITFTVVRSMLRGTWDIPLLMGDFMGAFFLVFGAFKMINWSGFVEAYQMYDLIAGHSKMYAYFYPLIELWLGIAYLTQWYPALTNTLTLILMLVSAAGVARELSKGKTIMCACLGVVFKIPMTYVTLLEDLLMAGMAAAMLYMQLQ